MKKLLMFFVFGIFAMGVVNLCFARTIPPYNPKVDSVKNTPTQPEQKPYFSQKMVKKCAAAKPPKQCKPTPTGGICVPKTKVLSPY